MRRALQTLALVACLAAAISFLAWFFRPETAPTSLRARAMYYGFLSNAVELYLSDHAWRYPDTQDALQAYIDDPRDWELVEATAVYNDYFVGKLVTDLSEAEKKVPHVIALWVDDDGTVRVHAPDADVFTLALEELRKLESYIGQTATLRLREAGILSNDSSRRALPERMERMSRR